MEPMVANIDRFHCAWTVLLGTACFPSVRKVCYEKALQVPKERIIYQWWHSKTKTRQHKTATSTNYSITQRGETCFYVLS